ncbi:sodium/hydrogen exchanger 11-like, partial [Stegodyphus dumicola]|uniref:sodium/hydrogen exchanger 11-like n=1 Tax=Stegodyphus dumicola TaxID=202533 RepID=UPI0015AB9749
FCTALTALFAKYVLVKYNWSWVTTFIFGVIVSATDPVAVVALLKEMRMPHSFTILIEGESLLNDGVAIVLFEILEHHLSGRSLKVTDSLIELGKTCFGAPAFGYTLAKISEWILVRIYISPVSEMTITFVFAYATYLTAERFLGISAVVAVVLYGITLSRNKMCISPKSESLVYTDWRLLAVYANTLIFIFVGILASISLFQHRDYREFGLVFVTYLALTVFRSLMIILFYPILKYTGYSINWKQSIILSWGGLRGAVGLALATMLTSNPKIDAAMHVHKILVQVAGIIVLTLLVNANTLKLIMKWIKFKEITLVNRLSMGNALSSVKEIKEMSMRICKNDWKYRKADWACIYHHTVVDDPYKGGLYGDDPEMSSLYIPYGTCDDCALAILPYKLKEEEMEGLNEAARTKVLRAMKGHFWKQFRSGFIQRRTLKCLSVAADNASDIKKKYLLANEVAKDFMKIKKYIHFLETRQSCALRKLESRQNKRFDINIHIARSKKRTGFKAWCCKLYFSSWFETLVIIMVILNAIHIIADLNFVFNPAKVWPSDFSNFSALCFVIFFCGEVTVKIATLGWYQYLTGVWNKFEFAIILICIVEGLIDFILMYFFIKYHGWITHMRIIILLRLLRIFQILERFCASLIAFSRNYTSSELYYVYDLGRAFLFANEGVLKHMPVIVDFKPSANIPNQVCKANISDMIIVLENFEMQYPGVAFALKSNRAARKILNRVESVLEYFKEKSLILKEDVIEVKKVLFSMTKNVVYAPRVRPIIRDVPKVLATVDWITNFELLEEIENDHVVHIYKAGQVLQETGVPHKFLLFVVTGIVKVVADEEKFESYRSDLYNKLPNSDSLLFFEKAKEDEFVDFLTISQTLGLLGYLQRTCSVTTAICITDCELIQVSYNLLDEAEKCYGNLIYSMWRSIAIKIAAQILKLQIRYKNCSEEDIKLRLGKGFLPDMSGVTYWNVPAIVDDMVIIQGRTRDFLSSKKFIAPAYIPSSYKSLFMLFDLETGMFV